MQSLRNLRVGVRLGLAFMFVLLLLVGIVGVGVARLADVNEELHTVIDNRYPKVLLSFDIQNNKIGSHFFNKRRKVVGKVR